MRGWLGECKLQWEWILVAVCKAWVLGGGNCGCSALGIVGAVLWNAVCGEGVRQRQAGVGIRWWDGCAEGGCVCA